MSATILDDLFESLVAIAEGGDPHAREFMESISRKFYDTRAPPREGGPYVVYALVGSRRDRYLPNVGGTPRVASIEYFRIALNVWERSERGLTAALSRIAAMLWRTFDNATTTRNGRRYTFRRETTSLSSRESYVGYVNEYTVVSRET